MRATEKQNIKRTFSDDIFKIQGMVERCPYIFFDLFGQVSSTIIFTLSAPLPVNNVVWLNTELNIHTEKLSLQF